MRRRKGRKGRGQERGGRKEERGKGEERKGVLEGKGGERRIVLAIILQVY